MRFCFWLILMTLLTATSTSLQASTAQPEMPGPDAHLAATSHELYLEPPCVLEAPETLAGDPALLDFSVASAGDICNITPKGLDASLLEISSTQFLRHVQAKSLPCRDLSIKNTLFSEHVRLQI